MHTIKMMSTELNEVDDVPIVACHLGKLWKKGLYIFFLIFMPLASLTIVTDPWTKFLYASKIYMCIIWMVKIHPKHKQKSLINCKIYLRWSKAQEEEENKEKGRKIG